MKESSLLHHPSAVLFDLDGTLADTREDIAAALNHALRVIRRPERTLDEVTAFIGDGIRELMRRGMGAPEDAAVLNEGVEVLRAYYEAHPADYSRLYPGVADMLARLADFRLGVVSNKPEGLSLSLLDRLKMREVIKVVVGGDTVPTRKPDPGPLLEAARRLGISPERCWMVGDSPGDVVAGKAAGMRTCAVTYGYRPLTELEAAKPDSLVSSPIEVAALLLNLH